MADISRRRWVVDDLKMIVSICKVEVDVPRSLGFYGGIAVAVTAGLVEPPLAVFVALVPLAKMVMNSDVPPALQWIGQVVDGASKPVGGDAPGTIRLADPEQAIEEAVETTTRARQASPQAKRRARRQVRQETAQLKSGED